MGAKKREGIRGSVYYSLDRSKSIFYNDSNDLHINLLFCDKGKAESFRTFLGQWYLNNPMAVQYGDVSVQHDMEVVYVAKSNLERVFLSDYTATESESPVQTLEELAAVPSSSDSHFSALSMSTPLAQLQSVERPEMFSHLRPVKCHIKPRRFKELLNDDNNLLAMSRVFHDCFDGMMTNDQKSGVEDVPLFAIKPPETRVFKEALVGSPPLKWKRVEIARECRDEVIGEMIGKHLKMGSEKVSGTLFKTFVHVANATTFCDCLVWKYKDVCNSWRKLDTE